MRGERGRDRVRDRVREMRKGGRKVGRGREKVCEKGRTEGDKRM